jgi:hypothetical protein
MISPKVEKYYVDNGTPMCRCTHEKIYKPCEEFHHSKNSPYGYQHFCKECAKKFGQKHRSTDAYENPKDLEIAREILQLIGYDINGDVSISDQFKTKYNL